MPRFGRSLALPNLGGSFLWVHALSGSCREAPVRTEPRPTEPWRFFSLGSFVVRGRPGCPGSDGASPYRTLAVLFFGFIRCPWAAGMPRFGRSLALPTFCNYPFDLPNAIKASET